VVAIKHLELSLTDLLPFYRMIISTIFLEGFS
jgi:hypothetical protein